MKPYKHSILSITLSTVLASTSLGYAGGALGQEAKSAPATEQGVAMGDMKKMFLQKKEINGYTVSFHVMEAQPGMNMGGTHDFMIKVEKDGKILDNLVMNTKVIYPDGKSETKQPMKMGEWLMAGYDLGTAGSHQLMILFKTADGKKHNGGVLYPR